MKAGRLAYYGVATWSAFRVAESSRDYINLFELAKVAQEVAGDQHRFRFIQLPFNLAMPSLRLGQPEIRKRKDVDSDGGVGLGIAVMGSATLYQARLTQDVPEFVGRILGTKTDAESAIQFSRSAPGLTTALIGMGRKEHVAANLEPALTSPTPPQEWKKLEYRLKPEV